tara:strand:+ start:786 stop:1040 length:255 start_codon:yes stop_codon:yes gene_type:complete
MALNSRTQWDAMLEVVEDKDTQLDLIKKAMWEGVPPDHASVPDEVFALKFEEMAKQDPAWVMALPFVEGGKAWLTRYERVRGLT